MYLGDFLLKVMIQLEQVFLNNLYQVNLIGYLLKISLILISFRKSSKLQFILLKMFSFQFELLVLDYLFYYWRFLHLL